MIRDIHKYWLAYTALDTYKSGCQSFGDSHPLFGASFHHRPNTFFVQKRHLKTELNSVSMITPNTLQHHYVIRNSGGGATDLRTKK